MKSILLATDLAAGTDRALERALKLAAMLSARLHILHVCPAYAAPGPNPANGLRQNAEETLHRSLDACREAKDLPLSVRIVAGGEIFLEIIQQAEKVRAGLIVTGMHGKTRLRDLFVGTTVERVIRKGVKPVLMVKDKPLGEYGNVLVGTDFSSGSRRALHVALELAPNSHFHLLHSYDIPDTYIGDKISQYAGDVVEKREKAGLEKFVREAGRALHKSGVGPDRLHCRIDRGDAFSCLMREAAAVKADLIAIGTHSRATLMPKLGGTAHDILSNPPCDVLVAGGLTA